MSEAPVWRLISLIIGLAIVVSISLDVFTIIRVPPQVLSFLTGCLISIAVGYTIVSKHASPIVLEEQVELKLRNQQYIVGVLISIALIILYFIPEVRRSPSSMIMVPIIFLGPLLVIREVIINRCNKKG